MGELRPGKWDEVVDAVSARHPSATLGKMFGMPCLRRADGRVVAALWKGGGIMVKLVDDGSLRDTPRIARSWTQRTLVTLRTRP